MNQQEMSWNDLGNEERKVESLDGSLRILAVATIQRKPDVLKNNRKKSTWEKDIKGRVNHGESKQTNSQQKACSALMKASQGNAGLRCSKGVGWEREGKREERHNFDNSHKETRLKMSSCFPFWSLSHSSTFSSRLAFQLIILDLCLLPPRNRPFDARFFGQNRHDKQSRCACRPLETAAHKLRTC